MRGLEIKVDGKKRWCFIFSLFLGERFGELLAEWLAEWLADGWRLVLAGGALCKSAERNYSHSRPQQFSKAFRTLSIAP